MVCLIVEGKISGKMAKAVCEEMFDTGKGAEEIVKEKGLAQISDEGELMRLCKEAISENPKAVEEYKSGKERALGAIVGAVMKKSKGKANPQVVNDILLKLLK